MSEANAVESNRLVRPFSEMTKEERANLSDDEWNAVPPEEKKSCHDCLHLKAVVNLWCGNEDAKKWRGTAIPGGCLCPFWEAEPPRITLMDRIRNFFKTNTKEKMTIKTPEDEAEVASHNLLAHCWSVRLRDGCSVDVAREILCKPITKREAMLAAESEGQPIDAQPIALKDSSFFL